MLPQDIKAAEAAKALGLKEDQVNRAFRDFQSKHTSTEHIRALPNAIERDWVEFAGRK